MQSAIDRSNMKNFIASEPLEVLAFRLGSEEYAIDIQNVNELRGYEMVTRIANAPEFMKGVVNLRGVIVPIVDMRIKFNFANPLYNQLTVVIIINVSGRTMGIVVDSVSDVITLTVDQMKPAPVMDAAVEENFIKCIGT